MINRSELVVTLTDYDNATAPYEGRAVRFRIVDDALFIYVGELIEGADRDVGTETFKFDDSHSIGVDAQALYEALGTMLRREDREAYDRARSGELPADHSAWRVQSTVAHVPATRVRA